MSEWTACPVTIVGWRDPIARAASEGCRIMLDDGAIVTTVRPNGLVLTASHPNGYCLARALVGITYLLVPPWWVNLPASRDQAIGTVNT